MKLLEFGDAVFIVTKTTTDIFTLVPSHNELFFYTWFSDIKTSESNSWFNLLNGFIYILECISTMLESKRFYLPVWIAIMLIILQIVQMFRDIIINTSAHYYVQIVQIKCNVTFYCLKRYTLVYFR